MRDAFLKELTALAESDDSIMLLTADLGFGVFEAFGKRFGRRFLNVGVAEQNMVALAAGMALEGKKVFIYSIGNFPTFRCLEQIRNDVCYHDANVKIVSVGGGFSYGQLGMSHHATEDLSVMRALPNMTVIAPGTAYEATGAVRALRDLEGPGYLRLDKSKADESDDSEGFILGRARTIIKGDDLALIATGGILGVVLDAAKELAAQGINCRVISMHTLKPLDTTSIKKAVKETQGIITVEENNILGGLGGAVAEYCLESRCRPKLFSRIGLRDVYPTVVGDQNYLRSNYGLDKTHIVNTVKNLISGTSS